MYAPIFFPPAPEPSAAVRAVERAILDAEGPYHVEGRYYSRGGDADSQRRLVAERVVRENARRAEYAARMAAACGGAGETTDAGAGESSPAPGIETVAVATWLTPRERDRVEAAKAPDLAARHHDDLGAVADDLASGGAAATLLSAARVTPRAVPEIAALVRGFPGAPLVAFVDEIDDVQALGTALLLGRAGVRCLVDARTPQGWRAFRQALRPDRLPDPFVRRVVADVLHEIGGASADGCVRFVALLFSTRGASAKAIAADLGVHPTTLASRFARAGLPSPKRYATAARLVLAAHYAEYPGVRLGDLARRLGASSPQSLGRTVRAETGLSASAFRDAYDGSAMFARFRAELVTPFRDRLRDFDPVAYDVARDSAPDELRTESARPDRPSRHAHGGACARLGRVA